MKKWLGIHAVEVETITPLDFFQSAGTSLGSSVENMAE